MKGNPQRLFDFLDERWGLDEEQEERRLAVEHDISARWPDLRFAVTPSRKVLRRGGLHVPPYNERRGYCSGHEAYSALIELSRVRHVPAGRGFFEVTSWQARKVVHRQLV